MHTVLETDQFQQACKDCGMTEDERFAIIDAIAANPQIGEEIKGTGGARKARFPKGNRGKSAGYRVITFFTGDDLPVFLMDVFSKGQKISLSKAECNELKAILSMSADAYKASEKERVTELARRAS